MAIGFRALYCVALLVLVGVFVGCGTAGGGRSGSSGGGSSSSSGSGGDSFMLPESDSESIAQGDAFTGAAMHFRKSMPARKPTAEQQWDFYFKHCSMNDNATHFSKTSYDCTGPYY